MNKNFLHPDSLFRIISFSPDAENILVPDILSRGFEITKISKRPVYKIFASDTEAKELQKLSGVVSISHDEDTVLDVF